MTKTPISFTLFALASLALSSPILAQSSAPNDAAELIMGAKPVSPAPGAGLCYEAINRGQILREDPDGTLVIVLEYSVFWVKISATDMRCRMARFTE